MYFVLFRADSSGRYIRIIWSVLLPVKQLWLASWWANVDKKALHLSRRTAFIKNCQSYGSLHNWVRSVIHLKQVNSNAYCLLYLRWIKSLLKPKYTSYGPLGLKDAYTLYHCSMVAFKFRHKHAVRGFFFFFSFLPAPLQMGSYPSASASGFGWQSACELIYIFASLHCLLLTQTPNPTLSLKKHGLVS